MKDKNKSWRLNSDCMEMILKKYMNNELGGKSIIEEWDSLYGIAEKPKQTPVKKDSVVFYSIPKD